MRAITIRQPWAWAVAHGGKVTENRTALFTYRGPLLIHAGLGWSPYGQIDTRVRRAWHGLDATRTDFDLGLDDTAPPLLAAPRRTYGTPVHPSIDDPSPERRIVFAAVLAVCHLADVHPAGACTDPDGGCHPWGETSYRDGTTGKAVTNVTHLVLTDIDTLTDPIAHRGGRLGLWTPPASLTDQVTDALDAQTERRHS